MYHVLVIDDKEAFRRKIQRLRYFRENKDRLSIEYTAQNGKEGLKILEEHPIDLVITDIRMPIMDGISLLREITARNLCPCTILLSEYAEFSYAREAIIHGAFDYVIKPITDESISVVLDRALSFLDTASQRQSTSRKLIELIAQEICENRVQWRENCVRLCEEIHQEAPALDICQSLLIKQIAHIYERCLLKRPEMTPYIFPWSENLSSVEAESRETLFEFCQKQLEYLHSQIHQFDVESVSTLVREICQYVLLHPEENITLQALASRFYVSKKHLSFLFKQETGMRFTEYATQVKIQRARILLISPEAKVYQVAEKLGYSDAEYFSKVFKRVTGDSPVAYMRRESKG